MVSTASIRLCVWILILLVAWQAWRSRVPSTIQPDAVVPAASPAREQQKSLFTDE